MEPLQHLTGIAVALPVNDIDTDQIIPARFLKVTDKQGLRDGLFYDWRTNESGEQRSDFILNQPGSQDATFLLAGDNFGCGSSREHAPWALLAYGFRVIVSTSFADIFKNNALKNGLLPVVVPTDVHQELLEAVKESPQAPWHVDVETQTLSWGADRSVSFEIDPFNRMCLIKGLDPLGYLLEYLEDIKAWETEHPPRINTQSPIRSA
jgi:3-isopropylmalate/(R)-2-methylmalate dehydratase small subunit